MKAALVYSGSSPHFLVCLDSPSEHEACKELIFLSEEQMLLWDLMGEMSNEHRQGRWGQVEFLYKRLAL